MRIITRAQARAHGLTRYFVGLTCRHGHTAARVVANGDCSACLSARRKLPAYIKSERARGRNISLEARRRYRGYPVPTRPEPERCECCGEKPNGAMCLDHDHTTGKFRGWICRKCNAGIGHLSDTLAGVLKAAKYLRRNV